MWVYTLHAQKVQIFGVFFRNSLERFIILCHATDAHSGHRDIVKKFTVTVLQPDDALKILQCR